MSNVTEVSRVIEQISLDKITLTTIARSVELSVNIAGFRNSVVEIADRWSWIESSPGFSVEQSTLRREITSYLDEEFASIMSYISSIVSDYSVLRRAHGFFKQDSQLIAVGKLDAQPSVASAAERVEEFRKQLRIQYPKFKTSFTDHRDVDRALRSLDSNWHMAQRDLAPSSNVAAADDVEVNVTEESELLPLQAGNADGNGTTVFQSTSATSARALIASNTTASAAVQVFQPGVEARFSLLPGGDAADIALATMTVVNGVFVGHAALTIPAGSAVVRATGAACSVSITLPVTGGSVAYVVTIRGYHDRRNVPSRYYLDPAGNLSAFGNERLIDLVGLNAANSRYFFNTAASRHLMRMSRSRDDWALRNGISDAMADRLLADFERNLQAGDISGSLNNMVIEDPYLPSFWAAPTAGVTTRTKQRLYNVFYIELQRYTNHAMVDIPMRNALEEDLNH